MIDMKLGGGESTGRDTDYISVRQISIFKIAHPHRDENLPFARFLSVWDHFEVERMGSLAKRMMMHRRRAKT